MIEVISLGAGVQSTVMALMAAEGELSPMPACAIFADTMFEPQGVYDHLNWLEKQVPYPVYRVSAGDIKDHHLKGIGTRSNNAFSTIPFYTEKGGLGRRQCTSNYKIDPIRKKLRDLLGLKPRQRAPKETAVRQWLGISTDEAMRMKPSRDLWVENTWPLIDSRMSRQDCIKWFDKRYPGRTLAKSACIACPFHNDLMWRDMKKDDPQSFNEAVEFDKAIRNKGRNDGRQYVHRSCKPLDEVDFRSLEDLGQLNLFNNECEGMCGV